MTDDLPKVAAWRAADEILCTRAERIALGDAAIAELEAACKDRERCGCCEHYRNCEIEFCMANPSPDGQFPMHWSDRCHLTDAEHPNGRWCPCE